ncbi:MAG TPA: hypothetical protein VF232_03355 [Gaiellaceae bacterium]
MIVPAATWPLQTAAVPAVTITATGTGDLTVGAASAAHHARLWSTHPGDAAAAAGSALWSALNPARPGTWTRGVVQS